MDEIRDEAEQRAVEMLKESPPSLVDADAASRGLRKANERGTLWQYVARLWDYRHFIVLHGKTRANPDTDDMYLGRFWNLLDPILRIAMYGTIFGLLLKTARGIENFLGFLVIGVMFFSMLSKGLSSGSGLLLRSRALMKTFSFPRATLVLSEGLRNMLGSVVSAVIAVIAALAFQQWHGATVWIFCVVPIFLLIHIFATGLMFFVARLTAFIPDARRLVFYVNRAWFFVSGVFFSVERYATVPWVQRVMEANPAYIFLSSIRDATMYGKPPSSSEWNAMFVWSFLAFLLGLTYFWLAEDRYAQTR